MFYNCIVRNGLDTSARLLAETSVMFAEESVFQMDQQKLLSPSSRSRSCCCSLPASLAWAWKWSGYRQFTPYVGTMVYSFAAILGLYLLATFLGSKIYRDWCSRHEKRSDARLGPPRTLVVFRR